jgi:hypothetical protein
MTNASTAIDPSGELTADRAATGAMEWSSVGDDVTETFGFLIDWITVAAGCFCEDTSAVERMHLFVGWKASASEDDKARATRPAASRWLFIIFCSV